MSDGETPLIRDACPIVFGWIAFNFSLPSVEIECNLSNSNPSAILMLSSLVSFSADSFSLFRYPPYFILISACSID